MARPRKTKEQHDRDGSFRDDRHFETVEGEFTGGSPVVPKWLNANQQRVWSTVVDHIPGEYLGEIDTFALEMLAVSFKRWWEAEDKIDQLDDDAETKDEYMLQQVAGTRWKQVLTLLGKFGMTPRDRTYIKKTVSKDQAVSGFFDNFLTATKN